MDRHVLGFVFMVVLLSFSHNCMSWSIFGKKESPKESYSETKAISGDVAAEFSMELLNDQKGRERVEKARRKLAVVGSNTCWQNAYQSLFTGCTEILSDEAKRRRFAWLLSDCFQKDSGGRAFPPCDTRSDSNVKKCLQEMGDGARSTYLAFFLEINSICHQLQADAFKRDTERLVNELKGSAKFAEEKLEDIEEKSENLLQSSKDIHDSLFDIDLRTQDLVQASKNVEDHLGTVLKNSEAVFEQTKGIAASQLELQEGQVKMKEKFNEGMTMIQNSSENLTLEINNLMNDAAEIQNKISRIGDTMNLKMDNLQNKTDNIGEMAGQSLDKQKELLDGQSIALEGLQHLTDFQTRALEESRATLQQLAEYGNKQKEEFLRRQLILEQAHDHLVENSKSMLEAQEAFETRQSSMFNTLDKLLALHNSLLIESRSIKAFFLYFFLLFIIFMVTSTKQTNTVRLRLYLGLGVTFGTEMAILWSSNYGVEGMEWQTWMIKMLRSTFVILSVIQLFLSFWTYRDYEMLNHKMLQRLVEKMDARDNNKRIEYDEMEDSDVDWPEWIDSDLPEDLDTVTDPDYGYGFLGGGGENSSSIVTTSSTRKYNLRNRLHH